MANSRARGLVVWDFDGPIGTSETSTEGGLTTTIPNAEIIKIVCQVLAKYQFDSQLGSQRIVKVDDEKYQGYFDTMLEKMDEYLGQDRTYLLAKNAHAIRLLAKTSEFKVDSNFSKTPILDYYQQQTSYDKNKIYLFDDSQVYEESTAQAGYQFILAKENLLTGIVFAESYINLLEKTIGFNPNIISDIFLLAAAQGQIGNNFAKSVLEHWVNKQVPDFDCANLAFDSDSVFNARHWIKQYNDDEAGNQVLLAIKKITENKMKLNYTFYYPRLGLFKLKYQYGEFKEWYNKQPPFTKALTCILLTAGTLGLAAGLVYGGIFAAGLFGAGVAVSVVLPTLIKVFTQLTLWAAALVGIGAISTFAMTAKTMDVCLTNNNSVNKMAKKN